MQHVPNALSLARILLTPVFFVALLSGTFAGQAVALAVFVVGAISDWLDGQLARRYDVKSRLGQFLDPLADKVLVLGAFVALMFLPPDASGQTLQATWWWLPIGLIALRDGAVTALRSRAERRGRSLRTAHAAKIKTAVQLTFLIALLVFIVAGHLAPLGGVAGAVGRVALAVLHGPVPDVLLVVTAGLTVWTGALYFRRPAYDVDGVRPSPP